MDTRMRLLTTVFMLCVLQCRSDYLDLVIEPIKNTPVANIDYELMPYVNEFLYKARSFQHLRCINVDDVYVGFTSFPDYNGMTGTLGLTYFNNWFMGDMVKGYSVVVLINRTYWDKVDIAMRVQLVFHELGHALLYRMHDDRVMFVESTGTAVYESVMNSSTMIDHYTFLKYETYYLNELFANSVNVFYTKDGYR